MQCGKKKYATIQFFTEVSKSYAVKLGSQQSLSDRHDTMEEMVG